MPIKIFRESLAGELIEEWAWLCDDEWRLAPQIEALATWIRESRAPAGSGKYIADIGFKWRRDAAAGGAVLEPTVMRQLADAGVSIFLSEYPGFADEVELTESTMDT